MITKVHAYTDSKGVPHASLEHAQKAELFLIFGPDTPSFVVDEIIANRDKVLDILTTTSKSKVRARKINGATRTRKPKRHEAEQFALPMEDQPQPAA